MEDIAIVFRKARVDLFYSSLPASLEIAKYEENLKPNLKRLHENINQRPNAWVTKEEFIGDWTLLPAGIDTKCATCCFRRIRVLVKDNWKSDLVRLKGGLNDYLVVGQIEVPKLRSFQSAFRSPSQSFKPVPDGFEIGPSRKVLPLGEAVE